MNDRPILVIAAMEDVELEFLKEKLDNIKEVKNKVCTFYEGEIEKIPVVLCLSDIGVINAAASVTYGIEKYNPKVIINEGVAGGSRKDIRIGDLVVGTEVINISSYETEKRKIGEGIKQEGYELVSFIHKETNRLIPQKANSDLIKIAKEISKNISETVHFGIIGSGDVWNKEADKIILLSKKYGIICEDMESISIYTVSNLYNIPVISIKAISNNEVLEENYDANVGIKPQVFTEKLIKNVNLNL